MERFDDVKKLSASENGSLLLQVIEVRKKKNSCVTLVNIETVDTKLLWQLYNCCLQRLPNCGCSYNYC